MNSTVLSALPRNAQDTGAPWWAIALGSLMLIMFCANGFLIWLSSGSQRDLVRSDYYEAGLDQDGVMARTALAHAEGGSFNLIQTSSGWRLEAPAFAQGANGAHAAAVCRAQFYRPDDGKEDRTLVLHREEAAAQPGVLGASEAVSGTGSSAAQAVTAWVGPKLDLRRGQWIVHLVWEEEGKPVMETSFPYHQPG